MNERPSPCDNCQDKPCDSSYNEDGECLKKPGLAQLIVLGGEQVVKLIDTIIKPKEE